MPVIKQSPRVHVRISRTINTAQFESMVVEAGADVDVEEGEPLEERLQYLRALVTREVTVQEKRIRKAMLDGTL